MALRRHDDGRSLRSCSSIAAIPIVHLLLLLAWNHWLARSQPQRCNSSFASTIASDATTCTHSLMNTRALSWREEGREKGGICHGSGPGTRTGRLIRSVRKGEEGGWECFGFGSCVSGYGTARKVGRATGSVCTSSTGTGLVGAARRAANKIHVHVHALVFEYVPFIAASIFRHA